jgi:hypothetical protein
MNEDVLNRPAASQTMGALAGALLTQNKHAEAQQILHSAMQLQVYFKSSTLCKHTCVYVLYVDISTSLAFAYTCAYFWYKHITLRKYVLCAGTRIHRHALL